MKLDQSRHSVDSSFQEKKRTRVQTIEEEVSDQDLQAIVNVGWQNAANLGIRTPKKTYKKTVVMSPIKEFIPAESIEVIEEVVPRRSTPMTTSYSKTKAMVRESMGGKVVGTAWEVVEKAGHRKTHSEVTKSLKDMNTDEFKALQLEMLKQERL